MIPAKTYNKTYNAELLVIVKVFKSCHHYLEGCQGKVLMLTNHNNLCPFINIKSLSFCQVRCAQELFRYYFRINNYQGKANKAVNALFRYLKQSQGKEKILQDKNTRIFQRLQSLLTNAYVSNTSPTHIKSLKYNIIYRTYALPKLCQSQKTFYQKLAVEGSYQASIKGMRLRLVELQAENGQVQKIRAENLSGNQEDFDKIFHYKNLSYVTEIIITELISGHHGDLLEEHFGIKKIQKFVARKYY